ncbi:MAG: YciI family protein [Bacteroidales bacterium]|nr:YciI family protein [Bacteroidales bacterium]
MIKNLFVLFAMVFIVGGTTAQTNDNLFFVFLNANPDRELLSEGDAEAVQAAHLRNTDKLAGEGKLLAGGPFEDGGGMFILRAKSMEQAKTIVQTDPAVQANRFDIAIHAFSLAIGDMCETEEPYEMVNYQMVIFSSNAGDNEQAHQLSYDTRVFMAELNAKKQNIVAQGYFDGQTEGVLILNVKDAGAAAKIFRKHPAARAGLMTYEVKTIWIAKGTFCE